MSSGANMHISHAATSALHWYAITGLCEAHMVSCTRTQPKWQTTPHIHPPTSATWHILHLGIIWYPTATSALAIAYGCAHPQHQGPCHVAGKSPHGLPLLQQHPCGIMGRCWHVSNMLPRHQHDATSVVGPPPYATNSAPGCVCAGPCGPCQHHPHPWGWPAWFP